MFARCNGFMGSEISVSPILLRDLLLVSAFCTSWPGASIMSGRGVGAVRLSEGRGQNNQQPTPNDNNKRVVVFLCGSGR